MIIITANAVGGANVTSDESAEFRRASPPSSGHRRGTEPIRDEFDHHKNRRCAVPESANTLKLDGVHEEVARAGVSDRVDTAAFNVALGHLFEPIADRLHQVEKEFLGGGRIEPVKPSDHPIVDLKQLGIGRGNHGGRALTRTDHAHFADHVPLSNDVDDLSLRRP